LAPVNVCIAVVLPRITKPEIQPLHAQQLKALLRIGEDHPDEELLLRDLWDDENQRDLVLDSFQADCEVRTGRPLG
jgi:hypothetical protein